MSKFKPVETQADLATLNRDTERTPVGTPATGREGPAVERSPRPEPNRQGAPPGGTPAIVCKASQRESVNPGPHNGSTGMGGEPEPISQSPAGGPPPKCPTDIDPVAASSPPDAVPAGDAEWHRRDAAMNYGEAIAAIRARLVAEGKARLHPDDAGPMPAFLRRKQAEAGA